MEEAVEEEAAPAAEAAPTPTPTRDGSVGSFLLSNAHLLPAAVAPASPSPEISEIDKYLELKISIEIDPLQWWATNEKRFPHVARMARQFLGCPATSASAERVFSLAGRLYSDLRQHMTDGTLEERMWAKVNRTPNK